MPFNDILTLGELAYRLNVVLAFHGVGLFAHQGLVEIRIEAVEGEQAVQFGIGIKLSVELYARYDGIKVVAAFVVGVAVNLLCDAASCRLAAHVDDLDLIGFVGGFVDGKSQVAAEGHLIVAGSDEVGCALGLALCADGFQLDGVGKKRLQLGLDCCDGQQVEGDGKPSVGVGLYRAETDLFWFYVWIALVVALPREIRCARHLVLALHAVQPKAGVCFHLAFQGDGLVQFVLFLRAVEAHLESGTLVFLHLDAFHLIHTIPRYPEFQPESAVASVGGDDERAAERAKLIGFNRLLFNDLTVHIAKIHRFGEALCQRLLVALCLDDNAMIINGLAWTVDGSVGEQSGMVACAFGA